MSSPTEAMPPALSKGASSPPEGVVQMPWAKGNREFWSGDTVRFNYQVQKPGDVPWVSIDGAAWSAMVANVWTMPAGGFITPGPHTVRLKAVRGTKTSRIQEFTYYIYP